MQLESETPQGDLTTRTLAMPADANPAGDLFGDWVLSQMDLGSGICAGQRSQGRVVTIANAMTFLRPVYVGDVRCVNCAIAREGRTSIGVHIEAWALHNRIGKREKVTDGTFTFVAIDANGRPKPLPA